MAVAVAVVVVVVDVSSADGARKGSRSAGEVWILHLLHRASLSADELFAFFVGFDGPSSRQYAVLKAVARNAGASQAAVVGATGIDRSTTSEMVLRLVKKGWLQRRRGQGRCSCLRAAIDRGRSQGA